MYRLLLNRNFGLAWWGGLISLLGEWMLSIALPILVYEITGSVFAVSTVVVARLLPSVLLGPVVGVFVDRWDRRLVMIATNLVRVPVVLALLLVKTDDDLWIAQVTMFLLASAGQLFRPAENAFIPDLVDEGHLIYANALNALNNNLASVVGPGVGGLVLPVWGMEGVVFINAVSLTVAAIALIFIRMPAAEKGPAPESMEGSAFSRFVHEFASGLRQIRRSRPVSVIFATASLLAMGHVAFTTLMAPFVVDILGGGSRELGWMLTAQGVGGIAGGLLLGFLATLRPPLVLLGWSVIVIGVLEILLYGYPALLGGVGLALGIKLVSGVPVALANATAATVLQEETPRQYRGRIFGTLETSMALVAIVVSPIAAAMADRVGLVPVLFTLSAATLVAGLLLSSESRRAGSSDAT